MKTTARERLAKVSGILLAHPDIKVEVDGYTDSTGDPMFNEQLSQQRAAAVQSYLTQQGCPEDLCQYTVSTKPTRPRRTTLLPGASKTGAWNS